MIIVRIHGGLGNQLFQYALGRNLAIKNNAILKLDITSFKSDKLRKFCLQNFNIPINIASEEEIKKYKGIESNTLISNFLRKTIGKGIIYNNRYYYKEKLYKNKNEFNGFQHKIIEIQGEAYLDGYWGSEKYFKDIEDIICEEFTVKYAPDKKNQTLINQILNCESVSLHIRRGDYVNDASANKLFGTCSMEYYDSAIKEISRNIENPHFFIFSDDLEWMQKNMKLSFPTTYVNINGADKDYEDLRLMSYCKHFIIPNSTFGWWGAWLSDNKNKIIIAPKRWYNSMIEPKEFLPKNWIRL